MDEKITSGLIEKIHANHPLLREWKPDSQVLGELGFFVRVKRENFFQPKRSDCFYPPIKTGLVQETGEITWYERCPHRMSTEGVVYVIVLLLGTYYPGGGVTWPMDRWEIWQII